MKAHNSDKGENISGKEWQHLNSLAVMKPSGAATHSITSIFSKLTHGDAGLKGLDGETILNELSKQNEKIKNGDLTCVQEMLLDQAHTLQALNTLCMMKLRDVEYIEQMEAYSRIALKAQNQSRQTLATLIELKNPRRATFIKQQNNAVNQQINNAEPANVGTEETQENRKNSGNPANELFEADNHEQLDTRAQSKAGGANQELETVGEIDRP